MKIQRECELYFGLWLCGVTFSFLWMEPSALAAGSVSAEQKFGFQRGSVGSYSAQQYANVEAKHKKHAKKKEKGNPGRIPKNRATPGEFEFYLLSAGWTTRAFEKNSFCTQEGIDIHSAECTESFEKEVEPFKGKFFLRGPWPQNEKDYPIYCREYREWVPEEIIAEVSDLMPASAAQLDWRKHGTCVSQDIQPQEYFEMSKKVLPTIQLPDLSSKQKFYYKSAKDLKNEVAKLNPEIPADSFYLSCSKEGALWAINFCADKELNMIACQTPPGSCGDKVKISFVPYQKPVPAKKIVKPKKEQEKKEQEEQG